MDTEEKMDGKAEDLIVAIGKLMAAEDAKISVLNVHRFKEFQFAYGVLANLLVNPDMRLKYELHEPFKSMGSISVEGKELNFTQAEWFSRVLSSRMLPMCVRLQTAACALRLRSII